MKNEVQTNGGPVHFRSPEELLGLSAEHLADDREFPEGAAEPPDEASRRDFIKLMSASAALAGVGLTGCRRPEEHIYAFGKQPEGYIHGVPQYFASAMPTRTGAIPLVVKSSDGRPTKVEGNAEHPDSNGATDVFAQASVLGLYDADRARRFTRHGKTVSPDAVWKQLAEVGAIAAAQEGEGLAFLSESGSSPSMDHLWSKVAKKFPKAIRAEYEAVDTDIHRRAASIATGQAVKPRYDLSQAKRILSLDCDFLGAEEDAQRVTRDFAKGRKIESSDKADLMNRLYVVESIMSQTGANADHRRRIKPSEMIQVAARLAQEVITLTGASVSSALLTELGRLSDGVGGSGPWITACAKDLVTKVKYGQSVVLVGERQPLVVHLLGHLVNQALKSKALRFLPSTKQNTVGIAELAKAIGEQSVQNLIIIGGNPVYNAPADLEWEKLQKSVNTIRLGVSEDETFKASGYHIPAAHYLESWGDARSSDGTYVPVQPLIAPLHDGVTALEVLARVLGESTVKPHDIVQTTFKSAAIDGERISWKKFLHDGFRAGSAPKAVHVTGLKQDKILAEVKSTKATAGEDFGIEVVFCRDYSVDDGRYGNNGWLQELPDPITKLTWDNAIYISRRTAVDEGLENGDIIKLSIGTRDVLGPVWVQPGQADGVLGVTLGYGRKRGGRIANFDGKPVGYDGYAIRKTDGLNHAINAKINSQGGKHAFAGTQEHWAMHGRPIVRETNLESFKKNPEFAREMDLEAHADHIPHEERNGIKQPKPIYKRPYEDPSKKALKSDVHQWGMVIDLNSCVGCSACVIACQSENNVPIVGKDQVAKRREMHWLRIDRYFTGDPSKTMAAEKEILGGWFGTSPVGKDSDEWKQDWIDEPQVVNQPMTCQHCENAPCESVCPVNATAHDTEGINVMAYNRCVGTRYCSNNCAWKVRRFNWFDYNKRPTNKLYQDNITDFLGMRLNERPDDEIDLLAMAKNPDVTVRMRGVMEKCTFCVQRVEQAKISQKVKAQDSADVRVKEGSFKTACQQSCPAEAIVFGNLLDEDSQVSKLKKDPRNYEVLGFLDNHARLTYLAKVRNPNPDMPDYHKQPFGMGEYEKQYHGGPFYEHKKGEKH